MTEGTEYPVELLQQSYMKPKLHTRLAPYTDYKSYRHDNPVEQFTVCQSNNKLSIVSLSSLLRCSQAEV